MSYGWLGHNFNLGYADGSLADAGAYTVRPGIAAADDEYPFAAGVDELVFREGISIRDLVTIFETLADYAATSRDTDILTEYVRQSLKRAISNKYFGDGESGTVVTLDPQIEQMIMGSVKQTEQGAFISLDPAVTKSILKATEDEVKKLESKGDAPIVVTSPIVRMYFKKLTSDYLKDLIVISYNEIDSEVELKSVGVITIHDN